MAIFDRGEWAADLGDPHVFQGLLWTVGRSGGRFCAKFLVEGLQTTFEERSARKAEGRRVAAVTARTHTYQCSIMQISKERSEVEVHLHCRISEGAALTRRRWSRFLGPRPHGPSRFGTSLVSVWDVRYLLGVSQKSRLSSFS